MKFIVNWFLLLTVPLWGGLVLFITFSLDVYRAYKYPIGYGDTRQVLKGKLWLWKI